MYEAKRRALAVLQFATYGHEANLDPLGLDDHQLKVEVILRYRDMKFSSAFDDLFRNAGNRCPQRPLGPGACIH